MKSQAIAPMPVDPQWLRSFVVKDGVLLGGLSEPQRRAALALAWAAVPAADAFSEAQINTALKQQLEEGALMCLGIDHVELRRWLVDCAFVSRDGFGRCYAITPLHALPPLSSVAAELVIGALADRLATDWADELRRAHEDQRALRRAQHAAGQAA